MTLHVFNPEHDIALAANLANFTPPHAARQLRHDLGFLPALWAAAGDAVLVDDADAARASLQRLAADARQRLRIGINTECWWLCAKKAQVTVGGVSPWGWDAALRARLRRLGVADSILPGDDQLRQIRQLSHRSTASRLMAMLKADAIDGLTGELPAECTTTDEVERAMAQHTHSVIKAPWSSSGRGVRFVEAPLPTPRLTVSPPHHSLYGWLRNVLRQQGSVVVEPCYDKVKDLALEYEAMADGTLRYCGLSLFHTVNGAYTANILATEQTKRQMLSHYLPGQLLEKVSQRIRHHLTAILQGHYQGPIGVDMMICHGNSAPLTVQENTGEPNLLLHPCVEVNLRRTMGHVALALSPADNHVVCTMTVRHGSISIENHLNTY